MSSAGAVRAGRAFVEITANDTEFQRSLKRVQHSTVRLGGMMRQIGSGMALAGGAMGLPMVLAARSAATFQDALLELQGAVSNISTDDLQKVRDESIRLSKAMGVAPEKIAQSFALLIKAGMPLKDALSGGAKAAVEFARVSGVEASDAAEFMKVAMNVFEISATQAADTLSAAADSSETSIASMVESFALVASVAKGTGQTLFGLSQGLAALARYGIKGEEAGTGIKTLLVKLLSPAEDAKKALGTLGISMESLVDSTGKLLPLSQIAGVFRKAMAGMGKDAREAMLANEALVKIFDVRGIRVIQAFADIGEAGFSDIATAMETSRTVSEKFQIAMSGITGSFEKLYAAVQRMATAFMVGASPALSAFTAAAGPVMDALSWILANVPVVSTVAVTMAGTLFSVGVAAMSLGGIMSFLNFGLKNYINFATSFMVASRSMTSIVGNLSNALLVVRASAAAALAGGLAPFVAFQTAYASGMGIMAAATHGLSAALVGLRSAMMAIPGWGWALAALAAAGGLAAWMASGSQGKKPDGVKPSGIERDKPRKPLAANDPLPARPQESAGKGETIGTFFAGVASRLGVGPSLTAAEETANNTARAADGIDMLVQQGERQFAAKTTEQPVQPEPLRKNPAASAAFFTGAGGAGAAALNAEMAKEARKRQQDAARMESSRAMASANVASARAEVNKAAKPEQKLQAQFDVLDRELTASAKEAAAAFEQMQKRPTEASKAANDAAMARSNAIEQEYQQVKYQLESARAERLRAERAFRVAVAIASQLGVDPASPQSPEATQSSAAAPSVSVQSPPPQVVASPVTVSPAQPAAPSVSVQSPPVSVQTLAPPQPAISVQAPPVNVAPIDPSQPSTNIRPAAPDSSLLSVGKQLSDAAAGMSSAASQPIASQNIPTARTLSSGVKNASVSVGSGVSARTDRELVSASERAAMAAEASRDLLRQLVDRARSGGLQFA